MFRYLDKRTRCSFLLDCSRVIWPIAEKPDSGRRCLTRRNTRNARTTTGRLEAIDRVGQQFRVFDQDMVYEERMYMGVSTAARCL